MRDFQDDEIYDGDIIVYARSHGSAARLALCKVVESEPGHIKMEYIANDKQNYFHPAPGKITTVQSPNRVAIIARAE